MKVVAIFLALGLLLLSEFAIMFGNGNPMVAVICIIPIIAALLMVAESKSL